MANVLFLSIPVSQDNRDKLTYNFIQKEAAALAKKDENIIHFHPNVDNTTIANITFTGKRQFDSINKLEVFSFIFKHIKNYYQLLLIDIKQAWWLAKLEIAIGKVIVENNINVAHSHFMYPLGSCAVNICNSLNIPVISSLRGAEVCNLPEYSYGAMREVFFQKASAIGARYSQIITTPNSGMQKVAAEIFRVDKSKVKYLPNGIDDDQIDHEVHTLNAQTLPINLIAIGRLIKLKNYANLLQAIKLLDKNCVQLTLVGEGPESAALKAYIEENSMVNVNLIDEMAKGKLFDLIKAAHYFIHPSLSEGLPNVVLEALAKGKPCLVSKIDAHFDVIEEGVNGYFFDHKSPIDIANTIKTIVEGPPTELSLNCLKSVEKFALSNKINEYSRIYKRLIK
ncbi:glycosyltransferase family 4 protein [Thalassotalea piscium]|uniref:Glycosyltransferase involved in cell wall biosynthesis n=1 Tax=Thalassotalea piscium TaxID=1230533 RepID=A0A7X0NEF0_9GAMM|nr:glycosyltransferase family 4 protein [Thalassotalea piscium]MBB6541927.1 glycosyltransferase involved in cell wall biosynthesis [Thalassotalea piscium]